MTNATSELANFIIDLEDEECPKFALHLAAYQGDIPQLQDLLKQPEYKEIIDARIRPFLATPLRLAATGQQLCVFHRKLLTLTISIKVDLELLL